MGRFSSLISSAPSDTIDAAPPRRSRFSALLDVVPPLAPDIVRQPTIAESYIYNPPAPEILSVAEADPAEVLPRSTPNFDNAVSSILRSQAMPTPRIIYANQPAAEQAPLP